VARLGIADVRPDGAGVYSRYRSGRPRLVVVARYITFSEGEILLVRLPDSDRGKGKIVDRFDPENGAYAVSFVRLVDPRDVVVELAQKHSRGGVVFRVRGENLVEIADAFADASNTPDLDGDGVPEIVWGGYSGTTRCGVQVAAGVLHWDGDWYGSDGRHYVAAQRAVVGDNVDHQYEFVIPDTPEQPPRRHFIVHVYPGRGAKGVRVLVDGESIKPGKVFELEEDCHTFEVNVTGAAGSIAWAMLEARP
jgi:hypothetical protein